MNQATHDAAHAVDPKSILLLHPGAMGAAIGARLCAIGHRVSWVSEGRSAETVERANAAGLRGVASLPAALEQTDIVLSVCPPHGAIALANAVAEAMRAGGFRGIYVDANAISPASSIEVGAIVEAAGARFVDGGIIGPPPATGLDGSTSNARLYLSGREAVTIARALDAPPLATRVLDGPIGKASALKMAYAGWNKGTIALLASLRALAASHGLDDALLAEWQQSDPDVVKRCGRVPANARKAWRWEAEMQEIADTFAQAGLPDGFHRSAAVVYARMHRFRQSDAAPPIEALNDALLNPSEPDPHRKA